MNIAAFRINFPEFSNATDYPDSLLNFWAIVAEGLVDDERWGSLRENALGLALAHYITIAKQSQISGSSGSPPGLNIGSVSQKKVGDVSVSYDVNANNDPNAGQFGKTNYGQQYLSLVKLFGCGAVQL